VAIDIEDSCIPVFSKRSEECLSSPLYRKQKLFGWQKSPTQALGNKATSSLCCFMEHACCHTLSHRGACVLPYTTTSGDYGMWGNFNAHSQILNLIVYIVHVLKPPYVWLALAADNDQCHSVCCVLAQLVDFTALMAVSSLVPRLSPRLQWYCKWGSVSISGLMVDFTSLDMLAANISTDKLKLCTFSCVW